MKQTKHAYGRGTILAWETVRKKEDCQVKQTRHTHGRGIILAWETGRERTPASLNREDKNTGRKLVLLGRQGGQGGQSADKTCRLVLPGIDWEGRLVRQDSQTGRRLGALG
jgi:hypothetical protein